MAGKIVKPMEAMNMIQSGDRILFSSHCGEPLTLLDALINAEKGSKI